ncbi:hypothetical protein [Streptomyces sp. NPDC090026]|uniref:hypothetical protein n=1 Tax=Streptomyces sp. NPDC090026 TaxID=3365923 RepID=UPI003806EFC8
MPVQGIAVGRIPVRIASLVVEGLGPMRQSHPRLHADSAPALVATARRRPRKAGICSPPEIRVNARSGQGRRRGPFATHGRAPSASDTTP